MKLLIDIGNTSAKLAISDKGKFLYYERLSKTWSEAFARLYRDYSYDKIVISSVAGPDAALNAALANVDVPVVRVQWDTPCPIKTLVGIPEGYGADRLAADFGAVAQDAVHPFLVIDAGTCITYDLFDASGVVVGGVISPGVQLRLKAMHDHTALLPLIEATNDAPLLAMNTKDCLLSGAVNGACYEIVGFIRALQEQYPDLHVFITGGNDFPIPSDITYKVTHDPYLVLRGLDLL